MAGRAPSRRTELWSRMKLAVPKEPEGAQLMVSWRHVDPGAAAWELDGHPAGIWDPPPASIPAHTGPFGVRLEAVKPELEGPLLPMTNPWETNYNMYFATVLHENGRYRGWYSCVPEVFERNDGTSLPARGHAVCYAESVDGYHWETPALGIYDFYGTPSNIVYGRELAPYGFQSGSIFQDPDAPVDERYKMFFLGIIPLDLPGGATEASLRERFGEALDERVFAVKDGHRTATCMCGATSPDGLHWTTLPEPILGYCSDTLNTCRFDRASGRYVAYIRMWRDGKRSIGRAESPDFRRWTAPAVTVLEADLGWEPSIDIYTNSRTGYPGSDERLMFPGIYDRYEDRRKVSMAVSEDEHSWNWVPGYPLRDCGSSGSWDAGDLNPGTGMVLLGEDKAALPVMVLEEPHKYPRRSQSSLGKPGWLVWTRGRLGCIRAERYGEFTSQIFIAGKEKLTVNYETVPRLGEILLEIRDADGLPIEGFTFDDAIPLTGNALAEEACWKRKHFSELKGQTVCFRARMRCAKFYAFELKAREEE